MSLIVTIETLASQGDGVAKHDGNTFFVPYVLPNETVKIAVKGKQVTLLEVQNPSAERVVAPCAYFGKCGGCKLQHMSETAYKIFKKSKVEAALKAVDLHSVSVEDVQLLPISSRRRTTLKTLFLKGKVQLGYYQKKSHELVDISSCLVLDPALDALLKPLKKLLNSLLLKQKHNAEVLLTLTDSGVDLLIDLEKSATIDLPLREKLAAFAQQHKLARFVVKHDGFEDPIAMHSIPVVHFDSVPVEVSPTSFLQPSKTAEKTIMQLMPVSGEKLKIADLFCGRGTFSLPLAAQGTVDAYEADKIALQALQQAARQHKKQVNPLYRNLFQEPLTTEELNKYDVVVLDPPRAGAQAQCATLAAANVPLVYYTSCNVDSFARDAKLLVAAGYTLEKITPVDQFRYAHHIEVVACFTQ